MRLLVISIIGICALSTCSFGQEAAENSWTKEYGICKHTDFKNFTGYDIKFVSPAFQITTEDHYWTEEEEKDPEKFKKARFMIELLYAPPFTIGNERSPNFIRMETPGIKAKNDTAHYYLEKNTRLSEFAVSFNFQYRIVQYKRFSMQLFSGIKFFVLANPGLGIVNFSKIFYWNAGVLAQLEFGMFTPYADIGVDKIYTLGTSIHLHSIFSKKKKRYKLHLQNKTPA